MSKTPIVDAEEIRVMFGMKSTPTGQVPVEVARRLEADRSDLYEALRAIESDEALYDTYFRSTATKPMARAEWERRNKWLTDTRAILARMEADK